MALRTTTWKYRNKDRLVELKEEAQKRGVDAPSVVVVGPGGIVESFARFFPQGKKEEWGAMTRLTKFFVHQMESILRKTDCFRLRCFEVAEVLEILAELRPRIVSVLDCERRVLEAVRSDFGERVSTVLTDITSHEPVVSGDIVVCYNTIQRTGNYMVALRTLTEAVNSGGLLSLTMSERVGVNPEDMGLSKISSTLFVKD